MMSRYEQTPPVPDPWVPLWAFVLIVGGVLLAAWLSGCARCDHATGRTAGRAAAGVPVAPVAQDLGTIRWRVDAPNIRGGQE